MTDILFFLSFENIKLRITNFVYPNFQHSYIALEDALMSLQLRYPVRAIAYECVDHKRDTR